ncbi:MAG TPA: 16S rRNA (guanine(966)-N(2))-methyltransferase RsmD [Bacillota bacterium]|nr:16S rRNA (guanine(966)-N(2))-methyltransferase RsmD [Bacillota bacterium]
MRITGGALCRRTLKAPEGSGTRPTQDRVRESMFAILAGRCEGSEVLDLFAGSGSLGFEAISRGAISCVFVESSRKAASIIETNAASLGVKGMTRVINDDAAREQCGWKTYGPFDIVFMDPPYASDKYEGLLAALSENNLVKPMGIVVVERAKIKQLAEEYGGLKLRRSEKYGATFVDFYQNIAED